MPPAGGPPPVGALWPIHESREPPSLVRANSVPMPASWLKKTPPVTANPIAPLPASLPEESCDTIKLSIVIFQEKWLPFQDQLEAAQIANLDSGTGCRCRPGTVREHHAQQGDQGSGRIYTQMSLVESLDTNIVSHNDPLSIVHELIIVRLGIISTQAVAVVSVRHTQTGVRVNVALY